MKIAVFIKPTLNHNMLRIESNKIIPEKTPIVIGEYDKNALEESIRIKEKYGGKVTVFSALTWGPLDKRIQELERIARECIAMGADDVHLLIDEQLINSSNFEVALAFSKFINKIDKFDLFLCSEASTDNTSYQFASRLGVFLNLPVLTFVRKIEIEENKVIVERDLEDEIEIVSSYLPCVISVTGEINQPRIPSVRQMLLAKSKPIIKHSLEGINIPKFNLIQEINLLEIHRKNIILEGNLEEIAEKLIQVIKEVLE